jgi:tetratricopeptide (TPR) repeat protein
MMRNLLTLLFPVLCLAQGTNYNFKEAELKARELVFTQPDSALVIIKKTLANSAGAHDTIKGNTYHLYGLYYNMKGMSDSAIYYYKKSLPYIDNYPKIILRPYINISASYRNKGEYETSLKYLNDALTVTKKDNNKTGEAMLYGEMASNYNYMRQYEKSVDLLLKAIAILKTEKKTKQLYAIKQKLANTYLGMENFNFAIDLYKECLPGFKEIGAEKNYYLTYINIGEAYIRLNNLQEAKKALKIAVDGLKKFDDKELIGITYSKIGNIENLERNRESALKNYKKSLDLLLEVKSLWTLRIAGEYIDILNQMGRYSEALAIINKTAPFQKNTKLNMVDRVVYEKAIAETYSKTNDSKAISAYKNTITLMDSISSAEKEDAVKEIQAKFQTDLQREKNVVLAAKNNALTKAMKAEKKLLYLYIIMSISFIVLILLYLRSYWFKNKLQHEQIKAVESEKALLQQQHLHELELNNAQKEIIEEKERELTSTTLQMANYQDSITQILEKCDLGEITKVSELKKELQHLIKQKDYWRQFETRFNSIHPEFNQKLGNKFSKLTKNDLEFCSLLKLNLSNKEIASLLQISHESAITKKYRIKKKMQITDDDEFEKILSEI